MKGSDIRNFVIIAHIDHGKSTLADRLLELTGTVSKEKMRPQYLDMMELERERGITIKMQPVRMSYVLDSKPYILNLIDTPGHVDFSYEVSRSLAAVEGAVLLVDATQGIQAQTLANLELAESQNLAIIPVVNKIDSPRAMVEETIQELVDLLKIERQEIIKISAKQGVNVQQVLEALIKKIPPPSKGGEEFRALIFDSKYDPYKGVLAYVRVFDGEIMAENKLYLMAAKEEGKVKEVGYFSPELKSTESLKAGEIGYIATGIKEPGKIRVGDTITKLKIKNEKLESIGPLPGYREPQPVVFASIYPQNADDFDLLKNALAKLKLNDYALTFEPETKAIIGRGFRCGFLGSLHAEIVSERLKREFGLDIVISNPSVVYKIIDNFGRERLVYSPADWPEHSQIKEIQEPWVRIEVITPSQFLGASLQVLENLGGSQVNLRDFGRDRLLIEYDAPLREMIIGFYDNLKGASRGYASMNYKILGYRKGDLVKLEFFIAGQKEEAFSRIVPREKAYQEGKRLVSKLKEVLPPQLFTVAIQAVLAGRVIARETIKARRKDVIAPLYGGDYTRKKKLLEKQKKGKQELKEKGRIKVPPKVYLEMFKS